MALPVFLQVTMASHVLPASVGAARFRKLESSLKIMAVFCAVACVQLATGYIFSRAFGNNYIVSDVYRVVEVGMLCAVYVVASSSTKSRRTLVYLGMVFAMVWLVDLAWFREPQRLNIAMSVFTRSTVIGMSVIVLYGMVGDEPVNLAQVPLFWVVAGELLYSTGTIIVLGFGNRLLSLGYVYFEALWEVNWSLTILANLFYTKAFLCKPQTLT